MRDEPKIEVGQVWRRKKDGTLVRITMEHLWRLGPIDDWSWRSVDGKRKGRSYGSYIRHNYELVTR